MKPDPRRMTVTVPLSYIENLRFGASVGPKSEKDPTLHWWNPDEDGVPHYRDEPLTPAELLAHRRVTALLDDVDNGVQR